MFKKLSVIIPVFNESNTIHLILNKVLNVTLAGQLTKEIVIVDDCSTDGTYEVVQQYMTSKKIDSISLYRHDKNQGKGAALHTSISKAVGDYIVIQDADLEYDPDEYNFLLKPVLDGVADVVKGSRFIGGNAHRILFFWHSIGNKFLTFLSNMMTNLNLTDMETCYKLFWKDPGRRQENRWEGWFQSDLLYN
jgi:glycosyltransferase involved in cell wall biosynthesis